MRKRFNKILLKNPHVTYLPPNDRHCKKLTILRSENGSKTLSPSCPRLRPRLIQDSLALVFLSGLVVKKNALKR